MVHRSSLWPLGSTFWVILPLLQKETCVCSENFLSLFPVRRILRVQRLLFILYFLCLFHLGWPCFCWYNSIESFVDLLGILSKSTPLNKSYTHKSWEKFLSTLGFCWGTTPLNFLEALLFVPGGLLGVALKFLKSLN